MPIKYELEPNQAAIITRFNKPVQVVDTPGWHWLWSLFTLRKIQEVVSTAQTSLQVGLRPKTSDNVTPVVPVTLQMKVVDAKKFVYNTEKPYDQVQTIAVSKLEPLLSGLSSDDLYGSKVRDTIHDEVVSDIGKIIEDNYGLRIVNVVVGQPQLPDKMQAAYNNVAASKKEAEAKVILAEADRKAKILSAEADAAALALNGKGLADQREAMVNGLAEQLKAFTNTGMSLREAKEFVEHVVTLNTIADAAQRGNVIIAPAADALLSQVMAAYTTSTKAAAPKPPTP